MAKAKEYADLAAAATRAQFVAKHPHTFLLLRVGDDDGSDDWAFKTTTVSTGKPPGEVSGVTRASLSQYRVFAIVKSEENPWAGRISVGRARNNDITLAHKSVSKLHAHFIMTDGGTLELSDAGSRNGTKINGERLAAGAVAPVGRDDEITFGAVATVHRDAAALYDFLHRDES